MIIQMLQVTRDILRAKLDLREEQVAIGATDDQPFMRSPDLYVSLVGTAARNGAPGQDYLRFDLSMKITVSVRIPHIPIDNPEQVQWESDRSALAMVQRMAWVIMTQRWKILTGVNQIKPQDMNGLAEPPYVAQFDAVCTPRDDDWWRGEKTGNVVGMSASVYCAGAVWLADSSIASGDAGNDGGDTDQEQFDPHDILTPGGE